LPTPEFDGVSRRVTVRGIPASPGVAVGPALIYGDILDEVEFRRIDPSEAGAEVRRFLDAVDVVKAELIRDAEHVSRELGQDKADVFLVHSMILEDRSVLDAIGDRIRTRLTNAEAAVADETKRLASALSSSSDAYLRDRAYDVTDIGKRVVERILGVWAHCPLVHPMIVVARELRVSDTVSMDRGRVLGFVTESGGRESHAAILARSLGVPAIVGAEGILGKTRTGDTLVVDGEAGVVIVGPSEGERGHYEGRREDESRGRTELGRFVGLPAETADGVRISLLANVGSAEEARDAALLGADGVGLLRTELAFIAARTFPSEDDQVQLYRSVAEAMPGKPVVIRTLDMGGDKFMGPENPLREHNPYLGYRSTRVLLDRPDMFIMQMKAILRSGLAGDVRMLWPMISGLDELRAARRLLDRAKEILRSEGTAFREDTPIGVMIEIPSAALAADRLAAESDFVSVGTNDLVQYTLAVDRGNPYVDHLYRPHDPAVLTLIARAIEGARRAAKPIALCGEMAGVAAYVPLLVGLGLRELSVAPGGILQTKKAIRETESTRAGLLAAAALSAESASDVEALIGWRNRGRAA
jgi:phosphotransferase system enzyme I (PtsI)